MSRDTVEVPNEAQLVERILNGEENASEDLALRSPCVQMQGAPAQAMR